MKKILFIVTVFVFALGARAGEIKTSLITEQDFYTAMQNFNVAKTGEEILAAASILIDNPPPKQQENYLYGVVVSSVAPEIKRLFAAVILTSMSSDNADLYPILLDAYINAKDPLLKYYCAAAVSLLAPSEKTKTDDVVALYTTDKIFALKTLNVLYLSDKKIISAVKKSAKSKEPSVRRGAAQLLGTFGGDSAKSALLAMLKSETDSTVMSDVAFSLSRMDVKTEITKCLAQKSSKPYAAGCSLTLGFMGGDGVSIVKTGLASLDQNTVINSLRAAAVMASTLGSQNSKVFSHSDIDRQNIKSLISNIAPLSKSSDEKIKKSADAALKEFSKIF